MHTIREDPSVQQSVAVAPKGGETLHEVLATQARERTRLELAAGAIVGGANAALIWARFPSLHWLAAGFAATACYGVWGLADRKLTKLDESSRSDAHMRIPMRFTRVVAAVLGWGAALFAIGAFLTAALGGLSIPGR